jgi:hypothetical protein
MVQAHGDVADNKFLKPATQLRHGLRLRHEVVLATSRRARVP